MGQPEKPDLRIGGASGFWGDAAMATPQLLAAGGLDFITYDYLAEITMAVLARARAKDPATGYATDFVSDAMAPNLAEIAKQGVRIVSNAGGVNPKACAEALRDEITRQGLALKVAWIEGDDLLHRRQEIAAAEPREMFSGAAMPPEDRITSINAYLGAAIIDTVRSAGTPTSVKVHNLCGNQADIALLHNEHTDPSDGVVFINSCNDSTGIGNHGGSSVIAVNHLELGWDTPAVNQIKTWLNAP